ncbi:MAG TPA: hypothetical protein VFL27_14875 [Candidatus Dormibacteraeota bacterium]|nr:hypothetical protein [Candidatus Dormibacteraeota bacterium]
MGATAYSVRRHTYLDSVFLMRVAQGLQAGSGVTDVAALMATPANKQLLFEAGFSGPEVESAGADDLVVGITARSEPEAEAALSGLDRLLAAPMQDASHVARSWDEALAVLPGANLAVISVPGDYAAPEIEHALSRGLHVFCFSSNVSLGDEARLKQLASSRGLLLMGPDCGTAIIAGKGIGFSNAVRRGPIGIVGGSGTGIQAVSCLIDAAGSGISHAIGCGSRDLLDEIGGITTFAGLRALAGDPETKAIVVVSKTPGPKTRARLAELTAASPKPIVTCFLGGPDAGSAATFDDAVAQALRLVGVGVAANGETPAPPAHIRGRARGLFAGGSLRYEAERILQRAGVSADRFELLDMGSEEITRGRAHPMIDPRLRAQRILESARDSSVGLLLLDFVLGRGAAMDPVGDLIPAIGEARRRGSVVVASVVGSDRDPQGLERQRTALRQAGVVVLSSSARAAAYVAEALR